MKKEKGMPAKTTSSKKGKVSLARKSKHNPPTKEEFAKALEVKKALPGDIAAIRGLQLKDEEEMAKYEPIVFSDTWYEFSVFALKIKLSKKTVGEWLDNGWLAYSQLGKIRIINKSDIEDMMLRFRKPAVVGLGYITLLLSDLNTWGFFCEGL